jgi:hypothetical protein
MEKLTENYEINLTNQNEFINLDDLLIKLKHKNILANLNITQNQFENNFTNLFSLTKNGYINKLTVILEKEIDQRKLYNFFNNININKLNLIKI